MKSKNIQKLGFIPTRRGKIQRYRDVETGRTFYADKDYVKKKRRK